jgi:hypothetical protein
VRGSELVQGSRDSCVSLRVMKDVFAHTLRSLGVFPGVRYPRLKTSILDSRFTDGGENISLKLQPMALYTRPHEDSRYSFLLQAE